LTIVGAGIRIESPSPRGMIHGMPVLLKVLLLAAVAAPAARGSMPGAPTHVWASGSIELPLVDWFNVRLGGDGRAFPCGDADHDGYSELYTRVNVPDSEALCAFEHAGANRHERYALFAEIRPRVLGHADTDNCEDLAFVRPAGAEGWLAGLESPDSLSAA